MKRPFARLSAVLLVLCFAFLMPHGTSAQEQEVSYARIVRLSYVGGDVQVNRPEESGWQQAMLNLPIKQGYQIATGQGRAEIEFESGAVARLAENSSLLFNELSLIDGGRVTHLTLTQGTATFYANLSSDDRFTVSTPHLNIGIPRNARFRVDCGNDGATVTVFKGEVSADHAGETYRVTKNRSLLFQAVDNQVQIARAPEMDSWDRWVEDRENVLTASREASLRYTHAPVSYGMADLYNYGGWVSVPGYGMCWRPFGVGLGWSPYYNGQWMYYGGFGLTWVSYEPWGWLPYHYGHWVWASNGWYWAPGGFNQWRPAVVYWVNLGGNRWGWGPLAPHDRPGQPPANLPHGTVTPTGDTPRGYIGGNRFERPLPGTLTNARVRFDPPDGLDAELRTRRTPGNRAGSEAPSGAAPSQGAAPAAGFSGRADTPQPRGVAPEDRGPRVRGRANDQGGPPSAIIYDRNERRYVNNPAAPTRPDLPGRVENPERPAPAAVSPRGYSGTATAPSTPSQPPARPSDMNRFPGRSSAEFDRPASVRPSSPQPRFESQPRPQYSSPRAEQPRPAPQPRMESPRPSPPPRMEAPHPAPQSAPRMEAPRPAPAPPAPRTAPRETPRRPPQ
jgi:hypothetical protein